MEREAKCLCGELSIKVLGNPKLSLACNCTNCQRRTGSVFGVGAYFENSQVVEKKGTPKHFQVKTDSGNKITSSFCANCGSTVFWQAEIFQGFTAIAVGCFTEPDFPAPSASVWNQSKYDWVEFPEHWHKMQKQEPKNA